AVLLSSGSTITRSHLPVEKMGSLLPRPAAAPPQLLPPSGPSLSVEDTWESMPRSPAITELRNSARTKIEKDQIIAALAECAGNQSQAAKKLGISRRTLVTRIEELSLPRPRKKV